MDYYLEDRNVINRLIREWKQYGRLVIAYDFDNTVFDYHGEGHSYENIVKLLRDCKEEGAYLIVFTSRRDEELPFVCKYLNDKHIPYDSINEQPPFLNFEGRKIYYNILLDDRAGLQSAFSSLCAALQYVQQSKT
ncbi:hypothetical protein [Paenibacillus polymyxa]|uniref:Uncharacterized protein n=1 Tax=Paenibacillus polymyxa (strain SC2) TaxID=886882 RepID=E3EKY5_PAEPS|nr:hypothetical protein [Paenibacillus polymyxa]ADO59890.1 hypothetical protein PPSC2_28710 [Paenibacillus polymyxa SC2]WPQ59884.1 hypothetical protein SKN87_26720 [Paenibacillus polymyxa]